MKKKVLSVLLAGCMLMGLVACGSEAPAASTNTATETKTEEASTEEAAPAEEAEVPENLTATQQIIKEAEGMSMEELAKKAIEESNGATFYGVGNSSRGKSALHLFIEYLL